MPNRVCTEIGGSLPYRHASQPLSSPLYTWRKGQKLREGDGYPRTHSTKRVEPGPRAIASWQLPQSEGLKPILILVLV